MGKFDNKVKSICFGLLMKGEMIQSFLQHRDKRLNKIVIQGK